jgi:hypothetical protein
MMRLFYGFWRSEGGIGCPHADHCPPENTGRTACVVNFETHVPATRHHVMNYQFLVIYFNKL